MTPLTLLLDLALNFTTKLLNELKQNYTLMLKKATSVTTRKKTRFCWFARRGLTPKTNLLKHSVNEFFNIQYINRVRITVHNKQSKINLVTVNRSQTNSGLIGGCPDPLDTPQGSDTEFKLNPLTACHFHL